MNFISLFAGIGGMDLGLERAGMTCVAQVEINPFCRAVLAKHWPHVPRFSDIRKVNPDELPEADLYAGGDPCQENSNARRAHDTTSPSLGDEFIRLVDARRPRLVLRENPARVRRDAPWPWHRFRAELERLGYVVLPFRLRGCCVGADHQRGRLFLLAELQDAGGARLEGHERQELARPHGREGSHAHTPRPDRWTATPRICRGAHGIPDRVDRIKSLGNAVVPAAAELIGRVIVNAFNEPCAFCGYPFDQESLGKYGCPNCLGDGLEGGAS